MHGPVRRLPFYGNYSALDSHANTVISHGFAYSSRWCRKPWQGLFPEEKWTVMSLSYAKPSRSPHPATFCHTLMPNTWSLLSSRRERVRSKSTSTLRTRLDRSRIEAEDATKKEQGDKGMVFSTTKRDFDFLNSCLYLSIGEVLCE